MNSLGERRFWVDLQEEKRNPTDDSKSDENEDVPISIPEFTTVLPPTEPLIADEVEKEATLETPENPAPGDQEPEPSDIAIETNIEAVESEPLEQIQNTAGADQTVEEIGQPKAEELPEVIPEPTLNPPAPLQKTSQVWRWIDDMTDEIFVERLIVTLADEQSALLLLVSARMATQKTADNPDLANFNALAKEVSSYVEEAHGIGKRRDAKTPPAKSQLSVVAHSVVQLLLDPHSAQLYFDNKKYYPPNLNDIHIKYGLIEDPNFEHIAEDDKDDVQLNDSGIDSGVKPDKLEHPDLRTLGQNNDINQEADDFFSEGMEGSGEWKDYFIDEDYNYEDLELAEPTNLEEMNDFDVAKDIEEIVNSGLIDDTTGAIVDQVVKHNHNGEDNSETLNNDKSQEDEELEQQIREAQEKIEALKAEQMHRLTTPEPIPEQDNSNEQIHEKDVVHTENVLSESTENYDDIDLRERRGVDDIPPPSQNNIIAVDNFENMEEDFEKFDEHIYQDGIIEPEEPSENNINDVHMDSNEILEPSNEVSEDQIEILSENNEIKKEQERLEEEYKARQQEEQRRLYDEIYYRQNMLCKMLMTSGKIFDSW